MPQGLQATGAQFGDKTSGVENLDHASGDSEVVHRKLWRRRSREAHRLTIMDNPSQDGGITPLCRPIEHGRVFPGTRWQTKEEQQNEAIRSPGSVTRRTTPN